MHIMRWTFLLLSLCGCFPPFTWKTPLKKLLFKIYTVLSFMFLHSLFLCQILDLVYNVENMEDFSDNIPVTAILWLTSIKVAILLIYRENFLFLYDALQTEPFLPMNAEEFEILLKFDKITDWNTIAYTILFAFSDIFIIIVSLPTNFKKRELGFRTWVPYDYSSASAFLLTVAYQFICGTICSFGCVASDSLYSSLLIHISCQFEILEHRLKNIKSNRNYSVKLCVRHHNRIYKYGEMVNKEFKTIMLFQFCTSLCAICFNFDRITQIKMDSKVVGTALYLISSLIQLLYYCWFGNEVKLKSLEFSDVIFRSDWISLNNNIKKAFLMLMRRAMRPIEFTSVYVISVNLEFFMTLVKTSYSAYNLFQQTRES